MPTRQKYSKNQCINMLLSAIGGLIYAIETHDKNEYHIAINYANNITQIVREDLN